MLVWLVGNSMGDVANFQAVLCRLQYIDESSPVLSRIGHSTVRTCTLTKLGHCPLPAHLSRTHEAEEPRVVPVPGHVSHPAAARDAPTTLPGECVSATVPHLAPWQCHCYSFRAVLQNFRLQQISPNNVVSCRSGKINNFKKLQIGNCRINT